MHNYLYLSASKSSETWYLSYLSYLIMDKSCVDLELLLLRLLLMSCTIMFVASSFLSNNSPS